MELSIYKQIIWIIFVLFGLQACDYAPESLPDKIIADYELAIPLTDTIITAKDVVFPPESSSQPGDDVIIPAGQTVAYLFPFPFYLSDFTDEGNVVEWVEPKAIFDNIFSDKIEFLISPFIGRDFTVLYDLGKDTQLTSGRNVLFGNTASRISLANNPSLSEANKLVLEVKIIIKEDITVKELKANQSIVQFGLRLKVKLGIAL